MSSFLNLQQEHERLLTSMQKGTLDLREIISYLDKIRIDSAQIGSIEKREQLRANARFWAGYIYDRTGEYPNTELLPATFRQDNKRPLRPGVLPIVVVTAVIGVALFLLLSGYLSTLGLSTSTPMPSATFEAVVESPSAPTPLLTSTSEPLPTATTVATRPSRLSPTPEATATATSINTVGISVQLLNPQDGQTVQPREILRGNYTNLRAGWTIHAILQPISGGGLMFPLPAFFTVPNRQSSSDWEFEAIFGKDTELEEPEQYNVFMVVANSEAGRVFLQNNADTGFDTLPEEVIPFQQVTTVLRPAYKHVSGVRLFFSRFLPSNITPLDIYNTQLDGTEISQITNTPIQNELYASISPNGQQIAYVEFVPTAGSGASPLALPGLWVSDSNGDNPILIAGDEFIGYERPLWSPDGRYVAFSALASNQRQIFFYDMVTSQIQQVTTDPLGTRFPSWLPDGTGVIYNRANFDLHRLDFSVRDGEILLDELEESSVYRDLTGNATHPAISPDGSKVAFTLAKPGSEAIREIHLLDLTTMEVIWLTTGENHQFPSWHPNGQTIFFEADDGFEGIWAIDVDGSNLRRIAFDEFSTAVRPYVGFVDTYLLLEQE